MVFSVVVSNGFTVEASAGFAVGEAVSWYTVGVIVGSAVSI